MPIKIVNVIRETTQQRGGTAAFSKDGEQPEASYAGPSGNIYVSLLDPSFYYQWVFSEDNDLFCWLLVCLPHSGAEGSRIRPASQDRRYNEHSVLAPQRDSVSNQLCTNDLEPATLDRKSHIHICVAEHWYYLLLPSTHWWAIRSDIFQARNEANVLAAAHGVLWNADCYKNGLVLCAWMKSLQQGSAKTPVAFASTRRGCFSVCSACLLQWFTTALESQRAPAGLQAVSQIQ